MSSEKQETAHNLLPPLEKKFYPEKLEALVGVEQPEIPAHVQEEAERLNMDLKPEFHVSVLIGKNAQAVKEFAANQENQAEFEAKIQAPYENTDWRYELLPEYYVIEKPYSREDLDSSGYGEEVPPHSRFTIIQKVNLPSLQSFFRQINELTDLDLEVPLSHVTLFSGAGYEPLANRGIGLYSEEDLAKYSVKTL